MAKKDRTWLLRRLERLDRRLSERNRKEAIALKKRIGKQVGKLMEIAVDRQRGLACKYCGSRNLVKYGHSNAKQVYMCKDCERTFTDNNAMPLMHTPSMEIGSALSAYYRGMSLKQVGEHLEQQYGHTPSKSTIYRWLMRYTKKAIDEAEKHTPKVGDVWVADETAIEIGGKKRGFWWFWDIIAARSRFLLASHISKTRTTKDAQILMEKALMRAGKSPQLVLTDHLAAYLDGVELTFGADAKHIQTKPFKVGINTNLIERFHGSIKDRTKVMRGLANPRTARLLLDGWLVHYNFFRPHESLGGKTPAEKAGIDFPFKDWLDVVRKNAVSNEDKATEGVGDRPDVAPMVYRCRSPSSTGNIRRPRKKVRAQRRPVVPAIEMIR